MVQNKVPPTLTAKQDAPTLRVSQVTIVVGLIDQYDAPQHILEQDGSVRQFQFFGDEHGTSIDKASAFLASVPAMLSTPPAPPEEPVNDA